MLEMGRGSSLSPAPEQMTSSIFLLPQTLLETVSCHGCSEPMKQVWRLGNATQKVQFANTNIVQRNITVS